MENELKVLILIHDHKQNVGKFRRLDNKNVIFKTNLQSINLINSLSKDKITKLFINLN